MARPSYPTARLHYDLPPELIAQQPPEQRGGSRLLHVEVAAGRITDRAFADLPELLPPGCPLVLNDSRVIPARVSGRRMQRGDQPGPGARVELLYLRYLGDGVIEAIVGSNAKLAAGEALALPGGWTGELLTGKSREGAEVWLADAAGSVPELGAVLHWLEEHGEVPLPPYIKRDSPGGRNSSSATFETEGEDAQLELRAPIERGSNKDAARYQTVYAGAPGSVAAPTAGLHFTDAMLTQLRVLDHPIRTVTLHVGLGTFAGVHVDDLAQHEMHSEAFSVPDGLAAELAAWRAEGRPVSAVGTTSLRVLHSLASSRGGAVLRPVSDSADDKRAEHCSAPTGTETRAFIYPGQGTRAADLLLTNFHLPGSTLLALVYAFGGEELLRRAYQHAIDNRFRFFSYGDCMLIDRRGAELSADGTAVGADGVCPQSFEQTGQTPSAPTETE